MNYFGFGEELTKDNLLSKVSSFQIFKQYCKNFEKVGKFFKSEFREEESPSCMISQIKGDLLYKDFGGTGESYRAIDYVMRKENISFREALSSINKTFNLGLGYTTDYVNNKSCIVYSTPKFKEKSNTIIQIKRRKWNLDDKSYWYDRYRITSKTLNSFNTNPISHFWINEHIFKADKFAYSYDFYWDERDVFTRKIYQPFSENKWFCNHTNTTVQGEIMLPKYGDLLIITKSMKDIMCLYELGYTAISPSSETTFVPEQYFIKQKSRFKKVILFLDNDKCGMQASERLSEKWGIPYILIPIGYEVKDISDFIHKYSQEEARNLMKELLNDK